MLPLVAVAVAPEHYIAAVEHRLLYALNRLAVDPRMQLLMTVFSYFDQILAGAINTNRAESVIA